MYHPSSEPDPKLMSLLAAVERPLMTVVAVVAGAILAFWLIPPLAGIAPTGWSAMSLPTSMSILGLVAAMLLTAEGASTPACRAGVAASVTVAVFGLIVVVLGFFQVSSVGGLTLPSLQTAVALLLSGTGIVLSRRRSMQTAGDATVLMLLAMLLFVIGGHLFNAALLFESTGDRLMSPQTIACLIAMALVLVARQGTTGGVFEVLLTGGMGSRIVRGILPAVIIAPFAIFVGVVLVYESGLLPPNITRALVAPFVVIGIFMLVGWMGLRINSLERSLQLQSVTDEMTKTLNRRGFRAVADYLVARARRDQTEVLVYFFDLDNLKIINDTLGHKEGNRLIKTFAEILQAVFRRSDVVARVGGDEFVALATTDDSSAESISERIADGVAAANLTRAHPFQITYSEGFATLCRTAIKRWTMQWRGQTPSCTSRSGARRSGNGFQSCPTRSGREAPPPAFRQPLRRIGPSRPAIAAECCRSAPA